MHASKEETRVRECWLVYVESRVSAESANCEIGSRQHSMQKRQWGFRIHLPGGSWERMVAGRCSFLPLAGGRLGILRLFNCVKKGALFIYLPCLPYFEHLGTMPCKAHHFDK